jgi:hypothetical protein
LNHRKLLECSCFCLLIATALASCFTVMADSQGPEFLSELMQKVSTTPEFRERMLDATRSIPKIGEWLSPDMVNGLRSAILGKDWQRVDHFPGFTIGTLNHSVDVTMRIAGSSHKPLTTIDLLDLGDYAPGWSETVDLDQPATSPTYAEDKSTASTQIASGITMGDGPDPRLAPMHAQSKRLAEVLNRLSLNSPHSAQLSVKFAGRSITDPGALIATLQATGYRVVVDDDLYFANFGHLHDGSRDVMMPFWLDTQIAIPATRRSLLIPVSHSEHELHVRGPELNADVSYYFGIDGKSEFRTMDSLNQPWVLGRHAFTYTGDRAVEVINLLAQATRVYLAVHLAHPELPFGGYYSLGVCQDTNAAIEEELQHRAILFPLTRDPKYFPTNTADLNLQPRDAQFLNLLSHTPDDRGSGLPPVDRVLGSLPAADLSRISIPGVASDLERVERARSLGLVQRTHPLFTALAVLLGVLIIIAGIIYALRIVFFRIRN